MTRLRLSLLPRASVTITLMAQVPPVMLQAEGMLILLPDWSQVLGQAWKLQVRGSTPPTTGMYKEQQPLTTSQVAPFRLNVIWLWASAARTAKTTRMLRFFIFYLCLFKNGNLISADNLTREGTDSRNPAKVQKETGPRGVFWLGISNPFTIFINFIVGPSKQQFYRQYIAQQMQLVHFHEFYGIFQHYIQFLSIYCLNYQLLTHINPTSIFLFSYNHTFPSNFQGQNQIKRHPQPVIYLTIISCSQAFLFLLTKTVLLSCRNKNKIESYRTEKTLSQASSAKLWEERTRGKCQIVEKTESDLVELNGDEVRAQGFRNIHIDYISQRMFSGLAYEVPPQTGKKTFGAPSRKEPGFSIGWDNANQMNDFQLRKSKNKEVTGKITTQAIIGGQQMVPQRSPYQQPGTNYYEPQAKDYEQILYENPNITHQELQKMMERYQQHRGVPSRSSKQGSIADGDRRVPIVPRESMKGILYNGVGVGEEPQRGARKRNNYPQRSEGHNYYQGNN